MSNRRHCMTNRMKQILFNKLICGDGTGRHADHEWQGYLTSTEVLYLSSIRAPIKSYEVEWAETEYSTGSITSRWIYIPNTWDKNKIFKE